MFAGLYGRPIVKLFFAVRAYNYKRQVRPTFLDTGRRNITVAKGGLAELRCRIRNLGPKEVGKTRHAAVHMENSNQILRPNSLTW